MRRARGITLVTVLIFVALTAGVYFLFAFGNAYWDNFEVNSILRQAANECYREPADAAVRTFIMRKLHQTFDVEAEDAYGRLEKRLPFAFDDGDLQIERTQVPKAVKITLTYERKVKLPLVDQERILTFNDSAEQDLSPIKW
jgi:hypothetical protein